jgi:hypothetical protein
MKKLMKLSLVRETLGVMTDPQTDQVEGGVITIRRCSIPCSDACTELLTQCGPCR